MRGGLALQRREDAALHDFSRFGVRTCCSHRQAERSRPDKEGSVRFALSLLLIRATSARSLLALPDMVKKSRISSISRTSSIKVNDRVKRALGRALQRQLSACTAGRLTQQRSARALLPLIQAPGNFKSHGYALGSHGLASFLVQPAAQGDPKVLLLSLHKALLTISRAPFTGS